MTSEVEPVGPRRRMILRRQRGGGGGGFSSGISTRSESLRASDHEGGPQDEVDDAIDPVQVANSIRAGAVPAPSPATPDRENPRSRLNEVALAGSASYAKEHRLVMLHRLLMRNVSLDVIARQLGVSISTVEKDRAELKRRFREQATQLNIDEMIGAQQSVYDEIAGMALRIASQGASRDEHGQPVQAVPTAMKLAAMRTALAANADRTRFLNTAGVFDVLRFRRAEDGANVSDVQMLMQKTQELLESLDAPEPPSAPVRRGSFNPMSFDDVDASGSAQEVQEL